MSKENKTCRTCIHYKNEQRELNYWDEIGFCVNTKFNFNTNNGRLVGVLDIGNLKDINKVSGNPSHDIETHSIGKSYKSRYLLQVSDNFGCIYHEDR